MPLFGKKRRIRTTSRLAQRLQNYAGRKLILGVRPQDMRPAAVEDAYFSGQVDMVEPQGSETYVNVSLGGEDLTARLNPSESPEKGQPCHLRTDEDRLYFFDAETGSAIY